MAEDSVPERAGGAVPGTGDEVRRHERLAAITQHAATLTHIASDLPLRHQRPLLGNIVLYLAAIPLALVSPWIALAVYVLVALIWLVPDRRIESAVSE